MALPNRFIPAGAGNTADDFGRFMPCTVHPRGRGEHSQLVVLNLGCRGSSPRARGTLVDAALEGALLRFIPAGAGNTHKP